MISTVQYIRRRLEQMHVCYTGRGRGPGRGSIHLNELTVTFFILNKSSFFPLILSEFETSNLIH